MNTIHTAGLWENFLQIVKTEVKPALGCTEPVSLALAAATAASFLAGDAQRLEATVSPNLMKTVWESRSPERG